jgi:hypothetical protein
MPCSVRIPTDGLTVKSYLSPIDPILERGWLKPRFDAITPQNATFTTPAEYSPMTTIEGIGIPDSKLCKEITELVRDTGTELLFNHSSRVYYFERSSAGGR